MTMTRLRGRPGRYEPPPASSIPRDKIDEMLDTILETADDIRVLARLLDPGADGRAEGGAAT